MPTIYRKTDKGRAEISTRAHHLPPRLRGLLIMVDGRRTVAQLAELGPYVPTGLSKLAEEGFLEALIERARGATPGATPGAAVAPVSEPVLGSVLTSAAPEPAVPNAPARPEQGPEFLAWRQTVVRALTDAVGPMAESLALRMERASTATELQPLLVVAQQVLRNSRGAAAARAFAEKFIGTQA